MLLMLSVHPSRHSDLLSDDKIEFPPRVKARDFKDAFGNICTRLVEPPGLLEIRNEFIIADSGQPDIVAPDAEQWPVDALPDDALMYLLGSRYCDTQKLSDHGFNARLDPRKYVYRRARSVLTTPTPPDHSVRRRTRDVQEVSLFS